MSSNAASTSHLAHNVFVYGTLKSGEPNHHVMTNSTTGKYELVASKASTVKPYPLVVASRYNIPFLLDKPGVGQCVQGEVYAVDDDKLAALDELESHPTYYRRRLEPLSVDIGSTSTTAWAYFLPTFRAELLTLPMLADYCSAAIDRPYVARYLRSNYNPVRYILGESDEP